MGLKDTRMQAFKLPLIMDAPSGAAVSDAAAAALDTLADGALPGTCGPGPLHLECHLWWATLLGWSSPAMDTWLLSCQAVSPYVWVGGAVTMVRAGEGAAGSSSGLDGLVHADASGAGLLAASAARTAVAVAAHGAAVPSGQRRLSPLKPRPAHGSSHHTATVEPPGLPLDALSFEVWTLLLLSAKRS